MLGVVRILGFLCINVGSLYYKVKLNGIVIVPISGINQHVYAHFHVLEPGHQEIRHENSRFFQNTQESGKF